MKPKKINLKLNKRSITTLDSQKLEKIKGGTDPIFCPGLTSGPGCGTLQCDVTESGTCQPVPPTSIYDGCA